MRTIATILDAQKFAGVLDVTLTFHFDDEDETVHLPYPINTSLLDLEEAIRTDYKRLKQARCKVQIEPERVIGLKVYE